MFRLQYDNFATGDRSWWSTPLKQWEAYFIGLALQERGRNPQSFDAATGQPVTISGPRSDIG